MTCCVWLVPYFDCMGRAPASFALKDSISAILETFIVLQGSASHHRHVQVHQCAPYDELAED